MLAIYRYIAIDINRYNIVTFSLIWENQITKVMINRSEFSILKIRENHS